MSVLVIRKE